MVTSSHAWVITMSLIIMLGAQLSFGDDATARSLPRSAPEAHGVSSRALLDFITDADTKLDGMHAFMLVRHGHVIAEGWWAPYSSDTRHSLFSLSKSFTSTAVGLAVNEGKLSIDDPVMKYFPDETPDKPSENLKQMRVRDLLTMSTGQHADDLEAFSLWADESLPARFLSIPAVHKPGTLFVYNTPATFMQSAIVQKVTGEKLTDYLGPRLFEPLGIENPRWVETKSGIAMGGTGLAIRTEDIAKFGLLYLQKGKWNGKQLVPESWVDQATSKQVSNGSNRHSDWDQGYGFQFWRCRHGFYRGDGAFGQYCIVMPEHDAVIAIHAGSRDMGAIMQLIWDKLLPAFERESLAADEANHAKLKSKLASLSVPMPKGNTTSAMAAKVTGKKFDVAKSDKHEIHSITLQAGESADMLVIRAEGNDHRITLGHGKWERGRSNVANDLDVRQVDEGEQTIAACGAWVKPNLYSAKICFVESPVTLNLQLRFGDDFVVIDVDQNVAFGATTRPTVIGEAK